MKNVLIKLIGVRKPGHFLRRRRHCLPEGPDLALRLAHRQTTNLHGRPLVPDILDDLRTMHPGESPLQDRAAAEIRRLRLRVEGLLVSNNGFETMYRSERMARQAMDKKYQDLRRLVLLEAADHCHVYHHLPVTPQQLAGQLRKKAGEV